MVSYGTSMVVGREGLFVKFWYDSIVFGGVEG